MKTLTLILIIINFYIDFKIMMKIHKFYEHYDKLSENDDIGKHIPKID